MIIPEGFYIKFIKMSPLRLLFFNQIIIIDVLIKNIRQIYGGVLTIYVKLLKYDLVQMAMEMLSQKNDKILSFNELIDFRLVSSVKMCRKSYLLRYLYDLLV